MILLRWLGSLSLPSSHTKFSSLFIIMEPMIFTYSFTIDGYDVTYYYSIFPSCYCFGRLFSRNNYEIANSWRLTPFYLTLLLGHFTVGLFSAEIFYRWAIFCRNILPLDCFLHRHFTAGLFLTVCFLTVLTCLL